MTLKTILPVNGGAINYARHDANEFTSISGNYSGVNFVIVKTHFQSALIVHEDKIVNCDKKF